MQKKQTFLKQALSELKNVRSLVGCGLLGALGIVIKALSVQLTTTLRISFYFLTIGISGYLFGPLMAGLQAVVIDLLGFLLSPTGPYFFGFTLNAFISGVIYGMWLYRRKVRLWRCAAACITAAVVINLFLNPLWLAILYQNAFWVLVAERLVTNAIQLPFNIAMLYGLLKLAEKYKGALSAR